MEDKKGGPRLKRIQNFAKEGGLEQKVKMLSQNVSNRGGVVSKLVLLKRITDGGLEAKPPAAERSYVIFWKK